MPLSARNELKLPALLLNYATHYRTLVFLRFFIAMVGGYVFTASATALLSVILPLAKQDAVYLSVSLSLLIYASVFIYAFAVKSLKTAWISILLSIAAVLSVLALVQGPI